jgi:NADPH2:quinone reductase
MKALVCVGPPELVELQEVPEPVLEPGQALVQVEAISVNRGELHRLSETTTVGWRPGWDFAGQVVQSPGDSLKEGDRVFGMALNGSWAEQIAVPAGQLALLPDAVPCEIGAAMPVAGLTALRTLRRRGDLAGQSVLVPGAAGGVGRFAVQLAHQAGARVTAIAGSADRASGLRELGADEVVLEMRGLKDRYDLILESVGGPALRDALDLLAPGGLLVSFGNSSRAETTFQVSDFYPKEAAIKGFFLLADLVREPVAADLAHLMDLYVAGSLKVDIAAVADWTDCAATLSDLRARRLAGKAVLRTRDSSSTNGGHAREASSTA